MQVKISGDNLQLATVSLSSKEEVNAEAGAMVFKSANVEIGTAFKGIAGTFKRLLTRESLALTRFTSVGGTGIVGFAGKLPGKIKKITLKKGEYILAEKGAYLCSDSSVKIDVHLVKKIGAGLLGGEGFILQKIMGPGTVLIHAAGDLIEYKLPKGKELEIDTSHLVAFDSTVDYDIKRVGGIKTLALAGEGLFLARMSGPGRVTIQSMTKRMLRPPLPRSSKISSRRVGGFMGRTFQGGFLND